MRRPNDTNISSSVVFTRTVYLSSAPCFVWNTNVPCQFLRHFFLLVDHFLLSAQDFDYTAILDAPLVRSVSKWPVIE